MVSKVVLSSLVVMMLLAGVGIGYTAAFLTISGSGAKPEYQEAQQQQQAAAIQRFRTYFDCIPPSHNETQITSDTWLHYNFDEKGNLMMIEIETKQRQDSPAWGYLPQGHPGMEFEHWALHVWFQDPEKACPDLISIVGKFRAEGVTVEPDGEVSQPFFSVKGQLFKVNGDTLQVYVYNNNHDAIGEAARVSQDGFTVGNTKVEWISPPHFYQTGKMIVIYLGDDAKMKQVLEKVVGYQFAGQ
ncbi:MAG: hypothetical protein HYY22_08730 [Thaumarchaeota archaeon]|nr:hypothetical protein [Nitrososphaerota archaeon]